MQKKILLAVDESKHARQAVEYAVHMTTAVKELHFVLLNIQPMISQYLEDEARKNRQAKMEIDRIKKRNTQNSQKLLDQLQQVIVSRGIPSARVETMTSALKLGLAKDIISLAQERRYDAIVAGRRGLFKLQEMIMGSTTVNLVEHSQVIPVWVIDGHIRSHKILVAIDASEHALRAVDHVCFMVADNPETRVTFFYVKSNTAAFFDAAPASDRSAAVEKIIVRENERLIRALQERILQTVSRYGIDAGRYEIQLCEPVRSVGQAVLDKAAREDFGTIVVGRRGINKSFFMGSVSRYIVSRASGCAVWVVS